MLGHSHALSGVLSGAAVSELVLHASVPHAIFLTGLTAGFVVLPDIDHCGTSVSRSFGFLSEGFAWVVGKLSGGHRHGTHSLLGVGIFTAAVWAASEFQRYVAVRWVLAVLLALALAAGLRALRIGGHFGDLIAIVAAVMIVWTRYGLDLTWNWPAGRILGWLPPAWAGTGVPLIAVACALGCATHIAGDMLTEEGCPLLWPVTKFDFKWWPRPLAFRTGTRPELLGVVPVLFAGMIALGWHAVMTGGLRLP